MSRKYYSQKQERQRKARENDKFWAQIIAESPEIQKCEDEMRLAMRKMIESWKAKNFAKEKEQEKEKEETTEDDSRIYSLTLNADEIHYLDKACHCMMNWLNYEFRNPSEEHFIILRGLRERLQKKNTLRIR